MTEKEPISRRVLLTGLGLLTLLLCVGLALAIVYGGYRYFGRPVSRNGSGALYLLDASERMTLPSVTGAENRLTTARNSLTEMLRPSPSEIVTGLRLFGAGAVAQSCQDTNLLVPLAPNNQQRIIADLAGIAEGGVAEAPLAAAMVAAIRDLSSHPGPRALVVITGGQDSCLAEASQLIAQELARADIDLQTFVIGFQVAPAEAQAVKRTITAADDEAVYLNAPDELALREALELVQTYVNEPSVQAYQAVVAKAATTSPPEMVNVTQNAIAAYGPELALAEDNRLHLIWWDTSDRATGDVFYRWRELDGAWSPIESVTTETAGYVSQHDAALRLRPDGAVCVFWVALSELNYYQRCRIDGRWEAAMPIFRATGIRRQFQPAFDPGGRLHFIYLDGAGSVYNANEEMLSGEMDTASNLRLVVDNAGRLHAVWHQIDGSYRINYRWSDDGGQTWADTETVVDLGSTNAVQIALQADVTGGVHLVWSTGGGLYYQRWQLAMGWETAGAITAERGHAFCDRIGLDVHEGGQAHVAWHTGSNGSELLYARQQADGSWTRPRLLSNEPCRFDRVPVLVVGHDNQAHLAWIPDSGERSVYYANFRYEP